MRLDPNGYPIPDPDAPKTTVGKIAAIVGTLIVVSIFAYGLWCLGDLLRHLMGLLP